MQETSETQPPEAIWRRSPTSTQCHRGREGLKTVKHLPDQNGLPAHVDVTNMREIPMETVEMTPPRRLVGRIAAPKLPFGGTSTFEITPLADGAPLRIIENGHVSNPVFRCLSRFVFGYGGTIENYLKSLARKFGEPAHIEM